MEAKLHKHEAASASPPSASSSPSHEFSFTISLHSSSTNNNNKTNKTPPHPSFAIDLTPADDIFFHGHLLPLHLLSHLPVSPRTSINSLDSFTLPIRELVDDQKPIKNTTTTTTCNADETKSTNSSSNKLRSFSLFGWRKGCEGKEKQKKKLKFEVSQVLKRYVRMVRPLLFFKGRKENIHYKQPYSFSGSLNSWKSNKQDRYNGKRAGYSAPASMRTSPSNSGLLVATPTGINASTSDSTMEELQAAIQAAIAHCKNSTASEEKIKC